MHSLIKLVTLCVLQSVSAQWHQNGTMEYFIENEQKYTYDEAVQSCSKKEATLVVIKAAKVQQFLEKTIGKRPAENDFQYYIGLHREFPAGLTWADGTKFDNIGSKWFSGQPNGGDCVIIGHSSNILSFFHWFDIKCSQLGGYICQRKARGNSENDSGGITLPVVIALVGVAFFIKGVVIARYTCDPYASMREHNDYEDDVFHATFDDIKLSNKHEMSEKQAKIGTTDNCSEKKYDATFDKDTVCASDFAKSNSVTNCVEEVASS